MNNNNRFKLCWAGLVLIFIIPVWIALAIITGLIVDLTEGDAAMIAGIEFWVSIVISIILGRVLAKKTAKKFNFLPTKEKSGN